MDTSHGTPIGRGRGGDGRVPVVAHPDGGVSTEARILEAIHDNVIVRSMDDRIVFWNRAAESTYGWTRAEVIGRTTHDLLRTKFPTPLETILADLRRNGRWEGELTHERRDGRAIVVASRWVLERDARGEPMRVLEVNNDVTERKLAEANLAARERQQAIIAHFGQEALRRIPIPVLMQKATRALADGLGVSFSKALLQTSSDDLTVVAGVGWRPGIVGEARVASAATSQAGFTMATRRPVIISDHRRERRFALPPFLEEHGIVSGMSVAIEVGGEAVGVITAESDRDRAFSADDVSFISAVATVLSSAMERDRAEAAVHAKNQELAEAVARLEAVSRKLEGSNADLAQFAYVASHDLQEPLRMVASYVQLLSRRYQGKLDADADDFIRFASEGAARMQRLINDLLEFSRVESRGAELKPTAVADVLARAQANLAVALAESGAKVNVGAALPTVLADEGQLTQLFQNLIGNAIKFRKEAPPEVTITVTRQGREWIFSVADNGIGIDPTHHDRIFIIFQRLHSRAKYEGTGIGLAICKKIVERHGGRIWVESVAGEGSTFRFTMPASEGAT